MFCRHLTVDSHQVALISREGEEKEKESGTGYNSVRPRFSCVVVPRFGREAGDQQKNTQATRGSHFSKETSRCRQKKIHFFDLRSDKIARWHTFGSKPTFLKENLCRKFTFTPSFLIGLYVVVKLLLLDLTHLDRTKFNDNFLSSQREVGKARHTKDRVLLRITS